MITGATGFIGRRLAWQLAENGHIVHALCRNAEHPFLVSHPRIKVFTGDILDGASLRRSMAGCEQLYHTAAMARMWCRNRNEFYEVNVLGTRHVLEAAREMAIAKVVHTSSCGVLGPTIRLPMTELGPRIVGFPIDYERTKYLADIETQQFSAEGMNIVTVYPSRVFGLGPVTESNTVGKIVAAYLKGRWRIIPGHGRQLCNYAYLDDVVQGHIAAMEKGRSGEGYILGGEDISYNEFFQLLAEVSGRRRRLIRLSRKLIRAFGLMESIKAGITGLPPKFLPELADRLAFDQRYSSAKAMAELDYQITPFLTGLEKTVHFLKARCRN